LAVRLNELETLLVYNNKIELTLKQMGDLFGFFIVFGGYQITRIAAKGVVTNLYWHFTGILLEKIPERKIFGSFQAPVNYRRNIA